MKKAALYTEFALLFVALPLAYLFLPVHISPLPVLWTAALYCYLMLRRDAGFPKARLWNRASIGSQLRSIITIFIAVAIMLGIGVVWYAPRLLFELVRERPLLWGLIMVLYPVLSVYPQSIVYRAFLMHRYAELAGGAYVENRQSSILIFLSAVAFAFMHIIFRNPLAVVMTFAGGLLFAWRYRRSDSLAASALEHSLYGCLMFTLGLGRYFYHGRL